ncbi:MAG: Gfo/Idh/MocA family oxidoreductase [Bacillota bacterium]|nr:Gfo/Idh/MocA family oxidoreductase [Bacillota bacterium]
MADSKSIVNDPLRVGFVGVGDISGIYLKNLTQRFRDIEVRAVCDLIPERSQKAAETWGVPVVHARDEDVFADPEIELVLNLTRPYEHYEVTRRALEAGKWVYSEKPLGVNFAEGKALFDLAAARGLGLGGAPDTFMGAGIQTVRRLIDDGYIGEVVGARCSMMCRGHESWHPDPAFYYQRGGGPMLDMGPYYVTALMNLLGGVKTVTARAKRSFARRLITSRPLSGTVIDVEVFTDLHAILEFDSGALATLTTTFDTVWNEQAGFHVFGSEGTIMVPDPNTFGGPVRILRRGQNEWYDVPLLFDYAENSRGLGLADMAAALRSGRPWRANGEQILHALDIMTSIEESAAEVRTVTLRTHWERGLPMRRAVLDGVLER